VVLTGNIRLIGMIFPVQMRWVAMILASCLLVAGCGTPGAPQPPSLNLPDAVGDLSAVRAGGQVRLTWTMPKRNTDRTTIKEDVPVGICRREGESSVCEPAGHDQMIAPGAAGSFTETLPPALANGSPRPLSYFVELRNRKGRSAGLSNAAVVLAGSPPAQVEGLNAEVRKLGVLLTWSASEDNSSIRLERRLLTPAPKTEHGPLAPVPEAEVQNLLVESPDGKGRAIDKAVRFGERYEYRAQRVALVEVNGKKLELDGAFSAPIDVEVKDVFPPAVPTGLVAVATAGENGGGPSIDLSWQTNTESDVAGYIVFRREDGGEWQRMAAETIVEPAFHDVQVKGGHTYQYAVSALDKGGHESARSAAAQETVPQQ